MSFSFPWGCSPLLSFIPPTRGKVSFRNHFIRFLLNCSSSSTWWRVRHTNESQHISVFFFLLNRAFNYGVIGFLMAKDILHMILPDSKALYMCFKCYICTQYNLPSPPHLRLIYPFGCAAVHSQIEAVRAVAECIWAHYLTVTGKKGELSLPEAQQQEVWVQYSALQIALRVRAPLYFLQQVSVAYLFSFRLSSHFHIFFCQNPSSGLSAKPEKIPKWRIHPGPVAHSTVSHILFSGIVILLSVMVLSRPVCCHSLTELSCR